MLNVIVGSKNPVKIKAVEAGFSSVFPNQAFSVKGISVPSDVADQPFGDSETLEGARNRAMNAQKAMPNAAFWVGVEGGVAQSSYGMEVFAWMCVLGNNAQEGIAKTATFYLPPKIEALVNQGMELGAADDLVFQQKNSKQGQGSVGILTHGLIDRAAYYQPAIVLALIPFSNTDLYFS